MTVFDLAFSFESAFLLGQSVLLISILALREDHYGIYKPLMIFFAANSINQLAALAEPMVALGAHPSFYLVTETLSIPAFLLLAPSLWLYVRGLTSEAPGHLRRCDLLHFIPSLVAACIAGVLLSAPTNVQETIIGDAQGESTRLVKLLTVLLIGLMLLWSFQVAVYVLAILRRILKYRARLKDVFASTEGRELRWLVWLIVLLVLSALILIPDFLFGLPGPFALVPLFLDLVLFWFLAVWGLRQKPGFAAVQPLLAEGVEDEDAEESRDKGPGQSKYEKSALSQSDMQRIAEKIEAAMSVDRLYLDADLSLGVLSRAISVQPNYVSQTLNGFLGSSFFDYVNQRRIEHAKPLLATTSEKVTSITYDVGFNSRSSFYKAFKQEMNLTPTAYRKQHLTDSD